MRLLLLILIALSAPVWGQAYPTKPVKVVIAYPPGSTPDIVGRTLSDRLQKALGQPFVVENRTGAGGNIGTDAVAKSAPDGHTLLVSINGRLSYGSVGGGSASHLTMELLKSEAGVFIVHIPYRGFPAAVTDMLAGNIDAMFATIPAVLPQVKAGKLRALAVTAQKRSEMAPEVPSVAELGLPQLQSLAWIGLLAPAGVSKEVIDRISGETVRGMRSPEVRELLGRQGFDVVASSPQEFQRWIRAESEKWARVIRLSGATPD